ncbi:amidohydrolase family protein [Beijerinckia sp. L45]|uniref:amidohydrolase family protein n=1 Tax=Beijerinckia sp. L45 TaxID=1641855 RepID=UPI00131AB174|nr:amidohydrolase family protein [Beijerinckia sp. L45]
MIEPTNGPSYDFCRIDMHAHYLPPSVKAASVPGQGHMLSSPMPSWSVEEAIKFMDRHHIHSQVLSLPVSTPDANVRDMNTYSASLVAKHPDRFGFFASLPLPDIARSVEEIGYSFDELHADGIVFSSNYGDTYLGNPVFDPVYAELDRRKAVVFVHPDTPVGFESTALGRPGPLIEFPMNTARTAVDMLFAGVFRRYPNIRFILAHAGGVLPTLAERIASLGSLPWVPNPLGLKHDEMLASLSGLFYDTAIAGTAASLWPVVEIAGPDQIVFGTDYPPASEPVIGQNIEAVAAFKGLTDQQRDAIGSNTAKLFPRLASAAR